jgi:hypothetical protein
MASILLGAWRSLLKSTAVGIALAVPKGVRNDGNEKLIKVDESGLNPLA